MIQPKGTDDWHEQVVNTLEDYPGNCSLECPLAISGQQQNNGHRENPTYT